LVHIFKALHRELGISIPNHGNLHSCAQPGALLLHSALTVEADKPIPHSTIGWHEFTNSVMRILSQDRNHLVFMLWFGFAKTKQSLIDSSRHLILTAAHPSPLSAYQGFFGCRHFSKANAWLASKGIQTIDCAL